MFETGFECKSSICLQVSDFHFLLFDCKANRHVMLLLLKGLNRCHEKEEVRLELAFWLQALPFKH